MERTELEQAYANLVTSLATRQHKKTDERRRHPRFRVHTQDLWVNDATVFQVRDVSASGIGLAADFPLAEGESLKISLRDDARAEAVVVHCKLIDSGSQYWSPLFHINCQFENEQDGMALVVMTKHLEQSMMEQATA